MAKVPRLVRVRLGEELELYDTHTHAHTHTHTHTSIQAMDGLKQAIQANNSTALRSAIKNAENIADFNPPELQTAREMLTAIEKVESQDAHTHTHAHTGTIARTHTHTHFTHIRLESN